MIWNTHRPITIEFNLNAVTLCGGCLLPNLRPEAGSKTPPTICASPSPLNLASEDPAVDSGLRKAVSLLKRHSIIACNITPAARLEGLGALSLHSDRRQIFAI